MTLSSLHDKRILLGVTGGIAAYKAAELTRLLTRRGASVRVAMTKAATSFVGPLTFQALSGQPVHLALLDAGAEAAMSHITLARWADLIVIAPATADFLAKISLGLADDLLSTMCLASEAPIAVAPAMNRVMWEHAATQEHVGRLTARGVSVLGPGSGEQACGEIGRGRLLEPEALCCELEQLLGHPCLRDLRVLVSAGPTREPIDPVRFLSNRSSGKMGYAVAEAAKAAGARVTLVSGPSALSAPPVDTFIMVETAEEMAQAVLALAPSHDIYIGAAAIADYRPAAPEAGKIKKHQQQLHLVLERTRDVLSAVAACEPRPFVVGFAAETDRLEEHARAKLEAKGADMVAANWVGREQGGFDRDDNALQVYWKGGEQHLPTAPKRQVARQLIELIADRYQAGCAERVS